MTKREDHRDWHDVSLPDARDAADALGWREELERLTAADVAESPTADADKGFRKYFVFRVVNGIGDAVRGGTPLDAFPKEAVEIYNLAGRPKPEPDKEA